MKNMLIKIILPIGEKQINENDIVPVDKKVTFDIEICKYFLIRKSNFSNKHINYLLFAFIY